MILQNTIYSSGLNCHDLYEVYILILQVHVPERLHGTELRERVHPLRSIALFERRFLPANRPAQLPVHLPRG